MRREPLLHNPSNPVTAGIWRVPYGSGTAIRKVIGPGQQRHPDWIASEAPRHWNYWRREALFYESHPLACAPDVGLRAPVLLSRTDLPSGEIELLLEDVAGRTGGALLLEDYVDAARRLGRLQAYFAQHPEQWSFPWTSQHFLRDYTASKNIDVAMLDSDEAWAHPLCRTRWPAGLRAALSRFYAQRERLLLLAESAPQTLCHLDFWSNNLICANQGAPRRDEIVVIDWACAGEGALGEDICNLIAEAVLDLYLPSSLLPELDARLYAAYTDGLSAGGYRGSLREVRIGWCASAVKFWWLGPLHLQRALTGEHHLYGGQTDTDPGHQYAERGAVLMFLAERAEEALRLSGQYRR